MIGLVCGALAASFVVGPREGGGATVEVVPDIGWEVTPEADHGMLVTLAFKGDVLSFMRVTSLNSK